MMFGVFFGVKNKENSMLRIAYSLIDFYLSKLYIKAKDEEEDDFVIDIWKNIILRKTYILK